MIAPNSLEYWAGKNPDKIAIIEGEHSMTFAEWNAKANRLANGFRAHGLGEGDIIVARTHTRIEWPIIQAAIGKIGGRMLVLNWRLTPPETQYILSDSGANAFICDDADPAALAPALEGLNLKLVSSVDAEADGFVPFSDLSIDGPELESAGDPPLIVYTSGTTGLPKGVESPKRPEPKPSSQEDDIALINMPMHHASAPNQLIRYRVNGWTTILQQRFDPEGVLALIDKYKVTQWGGVPTMFKRIFGLPKEVRDRYDVSSLRMISTGGGPSPFSLKLQMIEYFGPGKILENYGATEVGMMTHLPPEMQEKKPGSCGKANANVELEIRDEEGNVLPTGEVGIIWARTPTTIAKYLNKDPLTEDRRDAEGFFKVGDLGRFDEDGYLYLTDRAIDMIVSGGVNIYPAEIEAVMIRHPAVQDVAVVGGPNDEYGEEVIAYVELKPGEAATPDELAEFCKAELASYKRPRKIELIDELPRNTMGKLLKRDLRAPLWEGRERAI